MEHIAQLGKRLEHETPTLEQILMDEGVSVEKHREREPHGELNLEGIGLDAIPVPYKKILDRAVKNLADYTGWHVVKYAEPEKVKGSRPEWRQHMREKLGNHRELLNEFELIRQHDKKRYSAINLVVAAIDSLNKAIEHFELNTEQTHKFRAIVGQLPSAIKDFSYSQLSDEQQMEVIEQVDCIARELLHLFAPAGTRGEYSEETHHE